jgi:hypothetical protein
MTETDWLNSTDPQPMLSWLQSENKASSRKLRLFACACARRIWQLGPDKGIPKEPNEGLRKGEIGHLPDDEQSRQAIYMAERFVEGLSDNMEMGQCFYYMQDTYLAAEDGDPAVANKILSACSTVVEDTWQAAEWAAKTAVEAVTKTKKAQGAAEEKQAQAIMLREIMGNPFRRSTIQKKWLTPTVLRVAKGIYRKRAFYRMPQLADVLELIGCKNKILLEHCREQKEHAFGCWVLDSIMGKK